MHSPDEAAQLDLVQAFNAVLRHGVLKATSALQPSLAPWVDFTYSSRLCVGSGKIESSRGVQQGDPVGPLLFSLVLPRAGSRVQPRVVAGCPGTLGICAFDLDIGPIAGTGKLVA